MKKLKPDDVCRRALVQFDSKGFFSVDFMGREYQIYVDEERVKGPGRDRFVSHPEFKRLLLTYLISAQEVPLTGRWISEKDLQGGSLFFQGSHKLPTASLIERFGRTPIRFLEIGRALGGTRIAYGDAGIEFLALPRIPIACILWIEDQEFPARVTFLFDSSIESQFSLNVILVLVRSVVKVLLSFKGSILQ